MDENNFLQNPDINYIIDSSFSMDEIINDSKISNFVLNYLKGIVFVCLNEPNISQEISDKIENSEWKKRAPRLKGKEVFSGLTMLGEKSRERILSKLEISDIAFDKILTAFEDKDEDAYLSIIEEYDVSTKPISAVCTLFHLLHTFLSMIHEYQTIENDHELTELQKEEKQLQLNNKMSDLLICSGFGYIVEVVEKGGGFKEGVNCGAEYAARYCDNKSVDFVFDFYKAVKPELNKHIVEILTLLYFVYLKPRITLVSQDGFMQFLRLDGYEQMYDSIYARYLKGGKFWAFDYYFSEHKDLEELFDENTEPDEMSEAVEMENNVEEPRQITIHSKDSRIFCFDIYVNPNNTAQDSNKGLAQWAYDHKETVEKFVNLFATKFHYIEEGKIQVKAFARFLTGLRFDGGDKRVKLLDDKAVAAILYLSQQKILRWSMSEVLNYFDLPDSVKQYTSRSWHSKFVKDHADKEYITLVQDTFASVPESKIRQNSKK